MSGITQRGTLRWKEWVPLVSQQQRLRNLIQVIAYNIRIGDGQQKEDRDLKCSYYYTLHLTTMSSPLYTSERLESENPKWAEIEVNREIGAANGVVLRLWGHSSTGEDVLITVWGLYFSGLAYLGSRLVCADPSILAENTVVFHMQGGYFTAPHCFVQPHPALPRQLSIELSPLQVRPSYSVNFLLRLQTMQQAIKKQMSAASELRERISAGHGRGEQKWPKGESRALRKLLNQNQVSKPSPQEILAVKKEIELVKFKVQLLAQEKDRGQSRLRKLAQFKESLVDKNQEKSSELMARYCSLNKDIQLRKSRQDVLDEVREKFLHASSLLDFRRKQLMAELSYIYPIRQVSLPDTRTLEVQERPTPKLEDGRFTIQCVHLPNSEDFEGKDEMMISVALGYVAHLVQMIAFFLNVPTRYPIKHFGSRSKIIDHITDKIPDKDREFPLFSRGKEKLPFDYAVYLLNKNIAQLRWSCGITTSDLRATLPNLQTLMTLNKKSKVDGSLLLKSLGTKTKREKSVSCSLDCGVLNEPGKPLSDGGPCSDPQLYTCTSKSHNSPSPLPNDLATLMSLDLPSPPHPLPSNALNKDKS